jgi:magnesium chelatase family protein
VNYRELRDPTPGESSQAIRRRVITAREIQRERFMDDGVFCNARMSNRGIREHCAIDDAAESFLSSVMESFALSARAYAKILKASRTIADLEATKDIRLEHITEAIQYRSLDGNLWA